MHDLQDIVGHAAAERYGEHGGVVHLARFWNSSGCSNKTGLPSDHPLKVKPPLNTKRLKAKRLKGWLGATKKSHLLFAGKRLCHSPKGSKRTLCRLVCTKSNHGVPQTNDPDKLG